MLAIRMQRHGRKGHPTYRVVVQDVRQTPTSGKYVAMLGSYDPHTKTNTLVKDKAQLFLDNGAQPSDRVVRLFKDEGIKLPKWVKDPTKQTRTIRNPEKLRKNQPAKPAEEPVAEIEAADETAPSTDAPVEVASAEPEVAEKTSEETPEAKPEEKAPEASDEKPAESEEKTEKKEDKAA